MSKDTAIRHVDLQNARDDIKVGFKDKSAVSVSICLTDRIQRKELQRQDRFGRFGRR